MACGAYIQSRADRSAQGRPGEPSTRSEAAAEASQRTLVETAAGFHPGRIERGSTCKSEP
eukprot:675901-Amphidinium_carterae.1